MTDSAPNNVLRLVANAPEAQIAAALKERLRGHLQLLCGDMNEARGRGLEVTFRCTTDQAGRSYIESLAIIRSY